MTDQALKAARESVARAVHEVESHRRRADLAELRTEQMRAQRDAARAETAALRERVDVLARALLKKEGQGG